MKFFNFLITFSVACLILYYFGKKTGPLPPPGKFLDPFHGFWQNAEKDPINAPETLVMQDILEDVEIVYDNNLIPHIFARNEKDLYMTMGYVTAFHRLWQMEFQTAYAGGRLSEFLGEATLDIDRLKRRQGLNKSARKCLKGFKENPEINAVLEAYTKGVNYYIHSLEYRDYPFEYKLFDYSPETWTEFKIALLLKYMSAVLTFSETDIENTNALAKFGKKDFDLLFPEFLPGTEPVIPLNTPWDIIPVQIPAVPATTDSITALALHKTDFPDGVGSNNWAVSGKKTKNGYPILANDMHLALNLPSIWFQIQLNAPGINTMGYSLPGAPAIIAGFNDSVAWGNTNAYRDLVDWYTIQFRDADKNEYLYDGKWLRTEKVLEEIRVRDQETYYDTVTYTHLGPVVYEDIFGLDSSRIDLAMKWLGHDTSLEPLTYLKMHKAKNYNDFEEAYIYFSSPPQNVVFASTQGDIAMHINGNFPLKYPSQGKFLLDGTKSATDWHGYIPKAHNPKLHNPEQEYVSSANQHPVGPDYPYYTYCSYFEYARNRRINEMLVYMKAITPQDMINMQMDNLNVQARDILPLMLDSLKTRNPVEGQNIIDILSAWDFRYEADYKAPSYFEVWWNNLTGMIWDEFDDPRADLPYPVDYNTIYLMKTQPGNVYFDISGTEKKETLTDLIYASFLSTVDNISSWEAENGEEIIWKKYRPTEIHHIIPQLRTFGRKNLSIGGYNRTINAVTKTHGPSQRLVVELGPEVKAWSNMAGGQSGNPGNRHYDFFVDSWTKGIYHELLFMKEKTDNRNKIIFHQKIVNPDK